MRAYLESNASIRRRVVTSVLSLRLVTILTIVVIDTCTCKEQDKYKHKIQEMQLCISQKGYNSNIIIKTHEWNHNDSHLLLLINKREYNQVLTSNPPLVG